MGGRALAAVAGVVFLFLYLPLAIVVLYSFSAPEIVSWPITGYTF
jgi:ABC-type spermidine/putrescine transport system permease subunit II